MKKPHEYLALRDRYLPEKIRTVFVLESPPSGPGFFYDPDGRITEPLFSAFMEALGIKAQSKKEGLEIFHARGFFLIDPVYVPVNKLPEKKAAQIIMRNFGRLSEELGRVAAANTPVVIVKTTVFRLLYGPLKNAGFAILNREPIAFPSHGRRKEFVRKIRKLVKRAPPLKKRGGGPL